MSSSTSRQTKPTPRMESTMTTMAMVMRVSHNTRQHMDIPDDVGQIESRFGLF